LISGQIYVININNAKKNNKNFINNSEMSINKRIRKIREDYNLSQSEFAERIGVTRATVSQIEIGNQLPTIKMLPVISKKFNVNYEWIIDGDVINKDADRHQKTLPNSVVIDGAGKNDLSGSFNKTATGNCSHCEALENIIAGKNDIIQALKDANTALKSRIASLEKKKRK